MIKGRTSALNVREAFATIKSGAFAMFGRETHPVTIGGILAGVEDDILVGTEGGILKLRQGRTFVNTCSGVSAESFTGAYLTGFLGSVFGILAKDGEETSAVTLSISFA